MKLDGLKREHKLRLAMLIKLSDSAVGLKYRKKFCSAFESPIIKMGFYWYATAIGCALVGLGIVQHQSIDEMANQYFQWPWKGGAGWPKIAVASELLNIPYKLLLEVEEANGVGQGIESILEELRA